MTMYVYCRECDWYEKGYAIEYDCCPECGSDFIDEELREGDE
jgi:Zn finger protein HypA/HybF involved in hydrogenase expression